MMLSQKTGSNVHRLQDIPGKGQIKKLKSLMCLTIIYLSPKKDAEREHMLIKELELLSSGYMGFHFIFIEKNNSELL